MSQDGTAIAFAVLQHMIASIKCTTLFVTHYPVLGKSEDELKGIMTNCHMSYLQQIDEGLNEKGNPYVVYV